MKPLKVNNYFFLIMSQKDLVQNQVLEEILRERTNYYVSKNKTTDFWTLMSPTFIKELGIDKKIIATNFYLQHEEEITSGTNHAFYASLISLDKEFINWIQLRLREFRQDCRFKVSERIRVRWDCWRIFIIGLKEYFPFRL
jgi:hypothetical protein